MGINWTCDEKRARQHLTHSPLLDTRGKAEMRAIQEHRVSNYRRGQFRSWGTTQKLAQNTQEWSTFVAALHASRHNWHEWVSLTRSTKFCSLSLQLSPKVVSRLASYFLLCNMPLLPPPPSPQKIVNDLFILPGYSPWLLLWLVLRNIKIHPK